MDYEEYVQCLADLLSGDGEKIAKANALLYQAAIGSPMPPQASPALALVDAEAVLAKT